MKQQYDSYKPSGIDWIGDIPSHWNSYTLKQASTSIRNGYVGPTKDILVEDGIPYIQSLHVKDGRIIFSRGEYYVSPEWGLKHPKIFTNDIVIVQTGDIGQVALVPEEFNECNCHALIIVVCDNKKAYPAYLCYYLRSSIGKELMLLTKTGATLPHLNSGSICNTQIVLPLLSEQEAIAAWLDEKCGEIDAAIAKVDHEIELIDELKQSEISRVVTRGLNPDAPLCPSGIDWIGDVPEHWKICRIKHKADVVLGKMLLNELPKEQRNIYSKEKYLKSRNIGWLNLLLDEVDEMWFNEVEKSLYKLNDGDVLVNEGGDIGKVAIWHNQEDSFYIQNSVHKISPIGVTSGFLAYWIFSLSKRDYFWSIVSQVSIAHLTKEKLSNAPLIVPPLSEQQAIADYLDKKCAEIDELKAKLSKKRETLKELRQSIISEVVTGKRKVI